MLSALVRHRWNVAALVAMWLAFEFWISWAAFCNPANSDHGSKQGGDEYSCILGGPVASISRSFYRWWMHTFDGRDDYVVLLTLLLGLSTIGLWSSTRQLRAFTKIAAERIPAVERAWIFATPQFEDKNAGTSECSLVIKNHGKTPGSVKVICVNNSGREPSGPAPRYDGFLEPVQITLSAGESHRHRLPHVAIESEYFFGYVRYVDIFGDIYMSRFCYRVLQGEKRFEIAGHPAWNEHCKDQQS